MKKMTLSELVCTLQDLAHQGYAMFEVDLDLETHILDGYEVDKENEIVLLKSRDKNAIFCNRVRKAKLH